MLVLHGIYDNGKVEITDKNYPSGKTEVEVWVPLDTSHDAKNNQFLFECKGKIDIDQEAVDKLREISRL